MYRVGNPMYVRYNIYNICATYAGAADASDATKAAQPDKYLNQDGTQKTKWSVAGFTEINASRVAAARATEGFLECRYAGCHRAVARSRQKQRKTTCGKTNCPKN